MAGNVQQTAMNALRLETPDRGCYHMWVEHGGIIKRLRLLSVTREQLAWLALAGPLLGDSLPVVGCILHWNRDAFDALIFEVHILPRVQNKVPTSKSPVNTISRKWQPMRDA